MTADKQAGAEPEERPKFIWRSNLAVWVVLMALVMLTLGLAYLPLGYLNLPVALSIAAAKTLLIAIFFMELRLAKSFIRLAAATAFVWIAVMFALTFSDLAWRAG